MRLLICGSRTVGSCDTDVAQMFDTLNMLKSTIDIELVIHGDARGADTLGKEWAWINFIPVLAYPADWNTHGKAAGPIRNAKMLFDGKPTAVMAFVDKPLEQSRGTLNMVTIARKALGNDAVKVVNL